MSPAAASSTIRVTLPDGSIKEFQGAVTAREVAESIGARLAMAAVGARIDGELADLSAPIERDCELAIVTEKTRDGKADPDALYLLRHSAAHVMAEAIQRVVPGAQLVYGPPLETGFYYDIRFPDDRPLKEGDFEAIEAEMVKIVKEDRPFTRYELPIREGVKHIAEYSNEHEGDTNLYKLDNAYRAAEAQRRGRNQQIERMSVSWTTHKFEYPEDAVLSFYATGEPGKHWEDLCRGPHVPSTGRIGAVKIMSLASSYWHGDETSDRLTRVYGTAFFKQKDLDEYLDRLEQAKARDHRVLGKHLRLFHIDEMVGQGLVLWTPNGSVVRKELQNFISEELKKQGYTEVFTPNIGRLELFRTSGHFPYYADSQYPPMGLVREQSKSLIDLLTDCRRVGISLVGESADSYPFDASNCRALAKIVPGSSSVRRGQVQEAERRLVIEAGLLHDLYPWEEPHTELRAAQARQLSLIGGERCSCGDLVNASDPDQMDGYLLKPMNCPFHIKIFDSQPHSYRDMPVRLAEFGTVYRWEQSGELNGMTRVRGFTQDDAHLFCTPEQVQDELLGCLSLVKVIFATLGMEDYRVRVGLRDPDSSKYVGDPANWDKAEEACRRAAKTLGVPFNEEPGEAAFYGPKIDFVVKDVIGREWQLGTVQVDYNLPERFELSYIGPDNKPHRPVMIHRAPFGSMERFCGVLIEHFAGAFPTWLAPEQVRVLPISEKTNDYARAVVEALKAAGVRARLDDGNERVQAKIKHAAEEKVPYMAVVGPRDAEAGKVSVRARGVQHDLGAMALGEFVAGVQREHRERLAWGVEGTVTAAMGGAPGEG